MPVRLFSACMNGLEGTLIQVEVDIGRGFPAFHIVGLGDSAVQESKERIYAAIKNAGAQFPQNRKIVNLAPAHFRKHGPAYDLPISLGILAASKQLDEGIFANRLFFGELALDGSVKKIRSILPLMIFAKKCGIEGIFFPADNLEEASIISGIKLFPVTHLREFVQQKNFSSASQTTPKNIILTKNAPLLNTIKGQSLGKRAIQIAAAGGHHLLFTGPPGIGKTLLAKTLTNILPPLTEGESFEVTALHSIRGLLDEKNPLIAARPFRSIHQSITQQALLGGGSEMLPGEISLAHRGVLFLDEINEFPHTLLELLRTPLEDEKIAISRAKGTVVYPAKFQLIGTANPCPCGGGKKCFCSPTAIRRYKNRLSGALLDRIDLMVHLEMPQEEAPIDEEEFLQKIAQAHTAHTAGHAGKPQALRSLKKSVLRLLNSTTEKLSLSMRSQEKLISISRTIANLESCADIEEEHFLEAISFKSE